MYLLLRSTYLTGIRLDLRWLQSESTPLMVVFSALTITPATVHTLRLASLSCFKHRTTGPLDHRPYTLPPVCPDLGSESRLFPIRRLCIRWYWKTSWYILMCSVFRAWIRSKLYKQPTKYTSIFLMYFIRNALTNMFRPAYRPSSGLCYYYKNSNIRSCK